MAQIKYVVKVEKLKAAKNGVFTGWGMITVEKGRRYVDTDGDVFNDDALFDAFLEFQKNADMKVNHEGPGGQGQVLSIMPLSVEVYKSLYGQEPERAGMAIVVKPEESVKRRIESGEITGFSIAGTGTVEDA